MFLAATIEVFEVDLFVFDALLFWDNPWRLWLFLGSNASYHEPLKQDHSQPPNPTQHDFLIVAILETKKTHPVPSRPAFPTRMSCLHPHGPLGVIPASRI
jgi:hypothetical protein